MIGYICIGLVLAFWFLLSISIDIIITNISKK